MISAERVYEVFGFKDNDNLHNWHFHFDDAELKVYVASPEMLVALVNMVIELSIRFSYTGFHDDFKYIFDKHIKAIESADSKNRLWPEILKALEE